MAPSGVEFVRLRPPEVIQPGAGVEAEDVPEVGDIVSVGHTKVGAQGGRVQGEAEHVLEQSLHQLLVLITHKGLSIYYVSSYNKAWSFRMLTNAYIREQGFIQKLMSYENPI